MLTTSSGNHLEIVDNLHTIGLMNKLLTSQQQTSELMYVCMYYIVRSLEKIGIFFL